jgi:3-hydroxybutyryl-CoA dehydratase
MPVAEVGDEATVERTLSAETIEQFADLTGDDNPLYTDPDAAEAGFFGGVAAPGPLLAGIVGDALASLPGEIVYVSQDLEYEAAARPGDTVRATATVVEHFGNDRLKAVTIAQVGEGAEATTVLSGSAVVLSTETK